MNIVNTVRRTMFGVALISFIFVSMGQISLADQHDEGCPSEQYDEEEQCITPTLTPSMTPTPTTTTSGSTSKKDDSIPQKDYGCSADKPTGSIQLFQIDRKGTDADLHFTPPSGKFTTYVIEYGRTSDANEYSIIINYGMTSGAVVITVHDLDPKATYYFKVRAKNGCMPGDWSNTLSTNVLPKAGKGDIMPLSSMKLGEDSQVRTPVRLRIARLDVSAPIKEVGYTASGEMDVPHDPTHVGYFPMNAGAVISGHLDLAGGTRGVFADLSMLQSGDEVTMILRDGSQERYIVRTVETTPATEALSKRVFQDKTDGQLTLVTCAGYWNTTEGSYDMRTVVSAQKIPASFSEI